MRDVLIVGGGGLIGQAIAVRHLAGGDNVYIYDTQVNPYNDYSNLKGEDLSSGRSIEDVLRLMHFDVVSHQAAYVGVGESQYNIGKYVDNNVGFTGRLLQAISENKAHAPSKILLAGSMGPYGEGPYFCQDHKVVYPERGGIENPRCPICHAEVKSVSIDEDSEWHPKSIYGATKMSQEELVRIFANVHKISSISLRYFSVYGENSNPNNPYTGVLSVIANKIINSDSVQLYEDGEQSRDLIGAVDVAEAHWAASLLENENIFEAYNIGTGVSVSMKSVAVKMIELLDPGKKLIFTNQYRNGDIKHSLSDCRKFMEATGWLPRLKINDAIVKYCDFIKLNWEKFVTDQDTSEIEHNRLKKSGVI